jgi:hypothetical protein
VGSLPTTLEYRRLFALDSVYVQPPGQTESPKSYKRRVCDTIRNLLLAETGTRVMRIARLWPATDWESVWKNLQTTPVPETTKSTWYRIIHDIMPTNERLHKIRLSASDLCRHCDRLDTLEHRLTECGDGNPMWEWIRQRLALMLRSDPS